MRRELRGFSLLEMVVAIAILAMSLAVLYRAAGGATRNVSVDERYAYAVELAQSLLSDNALVPFNGVAKQGETAGGFQWEVTSAPAATATPGMVNGALQQITVRVTWADGSKQRQVSLNSVVEGVRL